MGEKIQRTDRLHNLYSLEKQALPENSLLWQLGLVYFSWRQG